MTTDLEKILEKAAIHVMAHHVSIGSSPANSTIFSPAHVGSGTFFKLKISYNNIVYGILTAAHVARWLKLGKNENGLFVGLSKLQNSDTIACSVTFPFIYHTYSANRPFSFDIQ